MIENLKEVCSAVWHKKDISLVADLLTRPEYVDEKKEIPNIIFKVLEQMEEMKKYGYDNAYLDQVKVTFAKAMVKSGVDLQENIVPVLDSISNARLKQNVTFEIASHCNKVGNQEAVDVLMSKIDIIGGARGIVSSY
jgi:hypothetical protein